MVKKVDVESDSGTFSNSSLIYQQCWPIICHEDTYCTFLLGVKECIGYGLTMHNVSIRLADQTRMSNGLFVNYVGNNRRFAYVTVYCDQSLKDSQIFKAVVRDAYWPKIELFHRCKRRMQVYEWSVAFFNSGSRTLASEEAREATWADSNSPPFVQSNCFSITWSRTFSKERL